MCWFNNIKRRGAVAPLFAYNGAYSVSLYAKRNGLAVAAVLLMRT